MDKDSFKNIYYLAKNVLASLDGDSLRILAERKCPRRPGNSLGFCLLNRRSYHGGWFSHSSEIQDQILSVALRAPLMGGERKIYLAERKGLFTCTKDKLEALKEGDSRTDKTASFQLGFSSENILDSGISLIFAQLASISLWQGFGIELASCPRSTDTYKAEEKWGVNLDIVISFGFRRVQKNDLELEILDERFDEVLERVRLHRGFSDLGLREDEIELLLWAAYGYNGHKTFDNKPGLTVPSAHARYYLKDGIYVIKGGEILKYAIKMGRELPCELIKRGETSLETPTILLCLDKEDSGKREALLEAGFFAGNLALAGGALGIKIKVEGERTDLLKAIGNGKVLVAAFSLGR
jgi:hypothetical protein